jgi:GNAT superfamily N-acetyltransferase
MTSGWRDGYAPVQLRLNHVDDSFADIIQGGWLTSHQPDGAWLYGADVSVRPEYRGRGLATALYVAWREVVWRLKLKGQVTAGLIPGYGALKETMPVEQYHEGVLAGRVWDPTVSMQMNVGFELRGLLAKYLNDPLCDNYCVLPLLGSEKRVRGASRERGMSGT